MKDLKNSQLLLYIDYITLVNKKLLRENDTFLRELTKMKGKTEN